MGRRRQRQRLEREHHGIPRAPAQDAADAPVREAHGDVDKALAGAAKVIEAEYYTPYLAHATDGADGLHRADQGRPRRRVGLDAERAKRTLATAAAAAGVPLENVVGAQDAGRRRLRPARRLAGLHPRRRRQHRQDHAEGTPVKLLWTREEDTQHDFYRPAALYRLKAGLDASGNPAGWYYAHRVAVARSRRCSSSRSRTASTVRRWRASRNSPTRFPTCGIEYAQRDTHVPVGFWRTVGWSQTPFVRECFLDELAHAAGKDPYEYRRALLARTPKASRRARRGGEGGRLGQAAARGRVPRHRGDRALRQLYRGRDRDVGEERQGVRDSPHRAGDRLRLRGEPGQRDRADPGGVRVRADRGSFWGEITIKDGRVEQSQFLRLPRCCASREMPKIEVVLAPTGGFWGGVGEPGLAPIAPALCNAIFAATGKRIRSLPLKNHGLALVKA